jgi:gas vesicle protein
MKPEDPTGEAAEQPGRRVPPERGTAGFAAGVLFGALLGAGFALLVAPDRGDKTRRRLRRRMQSLREDAREGIDRAGTRTREELRRRQRSILAELRRARDPVEEELD